MADTVPTWFSHLFCLPTKLGIACKCMCLFLRLGFTVFFGGASWDCTYFGQDKILEAKLPFPEAFGMVASAIIFPASVSLWLAKPIATTHGLSGDIPGLRASI